MERGERPGVWEGEREWLEHLEGAWSTLTFGTLDGFALDDRSEGGDGVGTVAFGAVLEESVRTLRLLRDIVCVGD